MCMCANYLIFIFLPHVNWLLYWNWMDEDAFKCSCIQTHPLKSLHTFPVTWAFLFSTSSNFRHSDMPIMFEVSGRKRSSPQISEFDLITQFTRQRHTITNDFKWFMRQNLEFWMCSNQWHHRFLAYSRLIHVSCVMFEFELSMFIWNKIPNIISVVWNEWFFFSLLFTVAHLISTPSLKLYSYEMCAFLENNEKVTHWILKFKIKFCQIHSVIQFYARCARMHPTTDYIFCVCYVKYMKCNA